MGKDEPTDYLYNKPPDEKFKGHFRNICNRPAMYQGEVNYKLVCALIQGIALGYQDWHGGFMHSFINEEFRRFLMMKYRQEGSQFDQVVWENIIPQGMKLRGLEPTDQELIDRLLQDFEDYNNVLVRMAVETSGAD